MTTTKKPTLVDATITADNLVVKLQRRGRGSPIVQLAGTWIHVPPMKRAHREKFKRVGKNLFAIVEKVTPIVYPSNTLASLVLRYGDTADLNQVLKSEAAKGKPKKVTKRKAIVSYIKATPDQVLSFEKKEKALREWAFKALSLRAVHWKKRAAVQLKKAEAELKRTEVNLAHALREASKYGV